MKKLAWEALLEASVSLPACAPRNFFVLNHNGYDYEYSHVHDYSTSNGQGDETNTWKLQIYNRNPLNPFCQPHNMPNYLSMDINKQSMFMDA